MDVMEEVMDGAPKWKSLGFALRLKPAVLDTISSKNDDDPRECLRDMLLAWLQQRYDVKDLVCPRGSYCVKPYPNQQEAITQDWQRRLQIVISMMFSDDNRNDEWKSLDFE
ncbi:hypothetical protein EMCRGX_G009388 [Ephydatia muelleri]